MGVRYTLIHQDVVTLPGTAAATFSNGINIPGGPIDELIVRCQGTITAADITADFGNTVQAQRWILNGENCFDYRAGYGSSIQGTISSFGYMLNSMGEGRSVEVMSTTLKAAYFRKPIGRNIPSGVSRLEYTLQYYLLATTSMVASAGAQFEVYARYNDAMQNTTTLGAATSVNYSATEQQVVVRLPQGVPGKLAAIYVQNDAGTDTDITGLRIVSQSDYSLDTNMWRMLNADLQDIVYADANNVAGGLSLSRTQQAGGLLFLPTFDLSLDTDLYLQVTCATAGVATFTPVIVAPVGAKPVPTQRQTQPAPTNVGSAILADSAAQV